MGYRDIEGGRIADWHFIMALVLFFTLTLVGGVAFRLWRMRESFRPGSPIIDTLLFQRLGRPPTGWVAKFTPFARVVEMTVGEFVAVFFYFFFLLIRFFDFWWFYTDLSPQEDYTRATARALGHVSLPVLMIQMMLGQRNTIFLWLFGIPFERQVKYHRANGYFFFTLISTHLMCWIIKGRSELTFASRWFGSDFSIDDVNPVFGLLSWLCFLTTVLVAYEPIRRRFFEGFYFMHFAFFPGNIFLLMHNRPDVLPWLLSAIILYYVDIGIRGWNKFGIKTEVVSAKTLDDTVVELTLKKEKPLRWEAGQYVWLAVSELHSASWACFHPYSICNAPNDTGEFKLLIKSMGPDTWSDKLHNRVKAGQQLVCRVGGPNGALTMSPKKYSRVILCAGGIGITPMLGVLSWLADCVKGGESKFDRVALIWAVKKAEHATWFEKELLAALEQHFRVRIFVTGGGGRAAETPKPAESVEMTNVATAAETGTDDAATALPGSMPDEMKAASTDADDQKMSEVDLDGGSIAGVQYEKGRPDWNEVLKKHAIYDESIAVYCCGPPGLMNAIETATFDLSLNTDTTFHLHKETFLF